MSKHGLIGFADLVRLCAEVPAKRRDDLAAILGYQRSPDVSVAKTKKKVPQDPPPEPQPPTPPPQIAAQALSDIPFWRLVAYQSVDQDEKRKLTETSAQSDIPGWSERPTTMAPFQPLAWWRELNSRLRHALSGAKPGRELDLDRIVARMGAGEVLKHLPRKTNTHWSPRIQIITDHSRRLIPYYDDQTYVSACLGREVRAGALEWAVYSGWHQHLVSFSADGSEGAYRPPPAGTPVLVLGDLGALAKGGAVRRFWREFGQELRAAGCRPVVLFPAARHRCPEDLARLWNVVPWERPVMGGTEAETDPLAELLRLVAPASRLEPGLLRAIRRLLPEGGEPGLEADLWQHPWLESDSPAGATIAAKHLATLRRDFSQSVPPDRRICVTRAIRAWRATLPEEIWFDELLNLDATAQEPFAHDRQEARAYMRTFALEAGDRPATTLPACDIDWLARNRARASSCYWQDSEIGQSMMRLDYALNGQQPGYVPPGNLDPAGLGARPGDSVTEVTLMQDGDSMRLAVGDGDRSRVLAKLRTINRVVTVAASDPLWKSGVEPAWASAWGRDHHGAWVEFAVGGVTQRLRWCPPGRFLMGSPESDTQADSEERPQHEVRLSTGFWLFDTPCTQALWQAVMGGNPSKFTSPDRPVEQVSWNDVQTFLSALNDRLRGLDLSLPTEAQWEYACRADNAAAPDLDAVAWYDGNSGDETHPVAGKQANAWGLYDMLGNVLEWCADGQRDYGPDAVTDPVGPLATGAFRVVRGGAWYFPARYLRAAFRGRYHPDFRHGLLGFRCARVQVSPASKDGAEPAALADDRQAERRAVPGMTGEALGLLRLDHGAEFARCALPRSGFRLLSDCERLTFDRITKPDWASAIGRDRFGLFVDFTVDKLTQRMRWIAPGRFRMGSPADEKGHWDNEGPQHDVALTTGFWLFDTPCPQGLWQAVMGGNPSRFTSSVKLPVEQVSWHDVQDFLTRLNRQVPGLELSLPTEAQWEYACRADSAEAPDLDAVAWYDGNSGGKTHPVASKDANAWGLYDMLGNVDEWCADGLRDYGPDAMTDPCGLLATGAYRVVRGGAWSFTARFLRAASRFRYHPDNRDAYLGFRCARVQA